jgi:hypothetical protein
MRVVPIRGPRAETTAIRGPDGLYRTMVRVDGYDCVRVLGTHAPAEHAISFAAGSVEVDLSDLEDLSDEIELELQLESDPPVPSRTITPKINPSTLLALLERERLERTGRRK